MEGNDKSKEINSKISNTLIEYKKQHNLTEHDMANKLGISLNYYLSMENNYDFDIKELVRISTNLEIPIQIQLFNK